MRSRKPCEDATTRYMTHIATLAYRQGRRSLTATLLAITALGCHEAPSATVTGTWGGPNGFEMQAGAHSTVVSYACISDLVAPLRPDSAGFFQLPPLQIPSGVLDAVRDTVQGRIVGDTVFAAIVNGGFTTGAAVQFGVRNGTPDRSGYICPE